MPTYHIDYVTGSDANDGSSWAQAKKTLAGLTGPTLPQADDEILFAKSPPPFSIGDGTWTKNEPYGGGTPSVSISSSTNAGPIEITTSAAHGLVDGDVVMVTGHLLNLTANGAWVITKVDNTRFTLDDSVGVAVGGATGTIYKFNYRAVKLAAAQTKIIDRCEQIWTAAVGSDATPAKESTNIKEGYGAAKITLDASVQVNILQAYKATGALDLSAYQKITLAFYNSGAIVANNWQIKLCSDAAGAVAVDTFDIPAIAPNSKWIYLTLTKVGGGNLGNNINSIAVYSGSSNTGMASKYIILDDIQACTSTGLNLGMALSKNATEQGGTDGWWSIQSINGKVVILDGTMISTPTSYAYGYTTRGTSPETITTYARDTVKIYPYVSSGSMVVFDAGVTGGTYGHPITIKGGYNIVSGLQDGETIYDNVNGFGYGLNLGGKSFVDVEHMSFIRCESAIFFNNASCLNVYAPWISCCTASGVNFGGGLTGVNVNAFIYSSYQNGVYFAYENTNCRFDGKVFSIWGRGFSFHSGCSQNIIGDVEILNTRDDAIYFGIGGIVRRAYVRDTYNVLALQSGGLHIVNNLDAAYAKQFLIQMNYAYGGIVKANKITYANITGSPVIVNFNTKADSPINDRVYIGNLNGTGYAQTWAGEYGKIETQAAVSGGSGKEWKLSPGSVDRGFGWPVKLILPRVLVNAGSLVTLGIYCKLSHATDVGARLVFPGLQIAGVDDDQIAICPANTSRNLLTVTFTPTEQGVVEGEIWVYWLANAADEYATFDDITINQV